MRRACCFFSGVVALLVGIGLLVAAGQGLARRRLPPEIEGKLIPVAKPDVVDLGHLGGHRAAEGKLSGVQGLAIIDSPLDSALAAYAGLTGREPVRDPSLPDRGVNFRGQASPAALARQLSAALRSNGVRMVLLGDGRVAAVRADTRLLWGNPGLDPWSLLCLLLGLAAILGGLVVASRSSRSLATKPLLP